MTSLPILDSNHVLNMLLANTFSHSVGPETEVALSYPPCPDLGSEACPIHPYATGCRSRQCLPGFDGRECRSHLSMK